MKHLLDLPGGIMPDWLLFLIPLVALLLVVQAGKWLYNRLHKKYSHTARRHLK
jgi:hypothetical protein